MVDKDISDKNSDKLDLFMPWLAQWGLGLISGLFGHRNPFPRSAAADAYCVRREPALKETLI